MELNDLLECSGAELMAQLRSGHPIEPSALDDREYRGVSLGLPRLVERLTWKTFKKVFHRDEHSGALRGWNVRMEQRGIDGPWRPKMRAGRPVTFGHFTVTERGAAAMIGQPGLVLDYGAGGNGRLSPLGLLRDPIVALRADDSDILLGASYLAFGRRHLPTPSFFALLRDGPLSHWVEPPAS